MPKDIGKTPPTIAEEYILYLGKHKEIEVRWAVPARLPRTSPPQLKKALRACLKNAKFATNRRINGLKFDQIFN